jgi:hypothetical protein
VVKVVDFKPLAPHSCGFESRQGLWILSYEEAIQLHVAYETLVVLCRCPFVLEMDGSAPEIFLYQKSWKLPYDLYSVDATKNMFKKYYV